VTPTPVRAPETPIAMAMRKADLQVEAQTVQPAPPQPVYRPPPPAPPPVVEEEEEPVPAPAVQPYQPPQRPQPAPAPIQNRAPPPFRTEPQTFQPASVPSERGWASLWGLPIGAILVWVGVFAFIGLVIGSAINYRYDVIRTWRPAATIYALFGFDVNVRGLKFEIQSQEAPVVQNDVVIKGEIVNVSDEDQPIPKILGSLLDKNQNPVHEWSFPIETQIVAPGKRVPFLTTVQDPPPTAVNVELRFAPLNE
jgi:hypothetical protein